jgi:hypothetical protein
MPDGDAIIAKWTRKREKVEEDDKKATEGMRNAIKSAMHDAGTHQNISRELLRARQGGEPLKTRSCWGDDGEEFTGIYEDRPWERD